VRKTYEYAVGIEKAIERLVELPGNYDNFHINHAILPKGEGLPVHNANAVVHLIVVKGVMTAVFDDGEAEDYGAGQIVKVDCGTKMEIGNQDEAVLEFFIVKIFETES